MTRPLLVVGLCAIHAALLAAGVLAPHDPRRQHRDYPIAPPTPLRLGWEHGRPGLVVPSLVADPGRPGVYRHDWSRPLPVRMFVRVESPGEGVRPFPGTRLFGVDPPGTFFLLGTDSLGRDVLSRLLHGGQASLAAALAAAILSLGIAAGLGCLAGYAGGLLDRAVMRAAAVVEALPWMYLLLAVRASLPLDLGATAGFLAVVAVLGLCGWTRPLRPLRALAATARSREYVLAARTFGASHASVLWRHVLPATRGLLSTQASLLVPAYLVSEVTLTFLGLGMAEPIPSWGGMLADLVRFSALGGAWWLWSPAAALAVLFAAYSELGRRLEERWRAIQV